MKLKVLIADDSKVSQIMIDEALSDELYSKRPAVNGQEALDLYFKWRPDVILLDIMMPLVSGYAALKAIRQHEKTEKTQKKTVVIMLTALSDKESIVDCMKVGIQGYMVKPFNKEELCSRIDEGLKKTAGTAPPAPPK